MTPGLLALGGAALASFLLILRDPAIHRGPERFIIAGSWPTMIALFAFLQHADVDRLGFAAVVAAICIATLGRPALIMDRVLTTKAQTDTTLTRRKIAGVAALLVTAGAAAAWSVWLE